MEYYEVFFSNLATKMGTNKFWREWLFFRKFWSNLKEPLLQLWLQLCFFTLRKLFFYSCRMQMKACIYTESKFLDNTETKMYLLRIFTEGKKSYFVEQPFLAGYLFLQKTVFCRSSLRGYFWIISYTFFSSNLTHPEPSSCLWFQLSK